MSILSGSNGETNLKERLNTRNFYGSRQIKPYLSALKSPVPATVKDADEYERFFKTYKDVFIPYSGTEKYSSHSLLGLLLSLKELSVTTSGVLLAKRRFALSGKIRMVKDPDETFDLGEIEPASDREKQQFYDFSRSVFWRGADMQPISPRVFGQYISDDLDTVGNAYIEATFTETAGQRAVYFDLHRPTDCLYLVTSPGENRLIAISPIWTEEYLQRKPPRILPVYPAMGEENGVRKTLIPVKEGNYTWYGRPLALSAMNYAYFEYQNSDYLNKAAYSQFSGQVMIEVEDAEPAINDMDLDAADAGFADFADKAEQRLTNKADDLQTMLVTSRPYGTSPAFVFQFEPNTNENWYNITNQEAERQILKAHGFPQRLVGLEANSGLSSNVFLDVVRTFSPTLFRELQQRVETPVNKCYRLAAEFLGDNVAQGISIRFTSPYQSMLDEQREQQQQNQGNGNVD